MRIKDVGQNVNVVMVSKDQGEGGRKGMSMLVSPFLKWEISNNKCDFFLLIFSKYFYFNVTLCGTFKN